MQQKVFCRLLGAVLFWAAALHLSAQGTAIFYQGRLDDSGAPANTNYDFRFAVFSAPTNGVQVSGSITNFSVPVSNGLFAVTLNFGPGVFNGTSNGSNDWLDIGVRLASGSSFTTLAPRQPILPVPYALFATSASNLLGTLQATQILGTISSSMISGAYSNFVNFANGTNAFAGAFAGNGANLTNLNASQIIGGTLADARLSTNVALLNGIQTFTGTNTFNGPGIYNGSNTFNGPEIHYGLNTFNNVGIFNGTNTFNSAGIYNGTNTFNGAGYYGGTNTFGGPGIYNGTNTFNSTGNYNGSNTFNGAGTYNGINTFSNFGNSFSGSFFGNGLVGWVPVSGATQQAVRDHGYMLTGSGLTTVTLPASSGLTSGDIVRVSGAGSGGWLAAVNSGQTLIGNFAKYANSFLVMLPSPAANGYGVAASADGTRIYVVGSDIVGVYASSDSGNTWNQVSGSQLSGDWVSVACSADGRTVYAEPYPSGTIYKSSNGGLTWASSGQSGNGTFIACTANGSTLFTGGIACSGNGTCLAKLSSGTISVSINGGSTFSVSVPAPATGVNCLAASSDCTRLVAGVNGGLLYTSSNQGATWTTITTTNLYLTAAWMSPDGSKFAAAATTSGLIGGGIFSSSVSPLLGTVASNSVCGSQGAAVELQYIGNNQFMPVSSSGIIWAN